MMRSGEEASRMLLLASGTVSVRASAAARAGKREEGQGGGKGREGSRSRSRPSRGRQVGGSRSRSHDALRGDSVASPARRRRRAGGGVSVEASTKAGREECEEEMGKIKTRGACFGDLNVLTGQPQHYSLVAKSEVWMVQVPREAIAEVLSLLASLVQKYKY